MQTWIFQGNPNSFNINDYLTDRRNILWAIRQRHFINKIGIGDEVFLWRADGGKRGTGGIIARAIVSGLPEEKEDDITDYWYTNEGLEMYARVPLEVQETRVHEGYIKRSSLIEHPKLCNLRILKMPNVTNYFVEEEYATIIRQLWFDSKYLGVFPDLQPVKRDREYKKYTNFLKDKVIFEYLFNGNSHRWLDENILGEKAEYSRGWFSMGILHFLGIVDSHKGFFNGINLGQAIEHLSNQDKDKHSLIISALLRYSEKLYEENDDNESSNEDYPEGNIFYRIHRMRERNPRVIKQAKALFYKKHGRLFCEVCNFDFSLVYGERGENFIEGHHKKLISEMKSGETTKVEDIAMLCANCHRMIHKTPLVTVEELASIVRKGFR